MQSLDEILNKYQKDDPKNTLPPPNSYGITEEEIEAQKQKILSEMGISLKEVSREMPRYDTGANKTQNLLQSLQTEVGRLQAVSDASKLRKSMALLESKGKDRLSMGSHVIISQAIRSTPNHLVNYEDELEENKVFYKEIQIIEKNKEKLHEITEEIIKQKSEIPEILLKSAQDQTDSIDFEELEKLKAQHAVKLRILEEEYQKKKAEEKNEPPAVPSQPLKIFEKAPIRKSTTVSKDVANYPTYGRGKDPAPDIESYMYNTKLLSSESPLKQKKKKTLKPKPISLVKLRFS